MTKIIVFTGLFFSGQIFLAQSNSKWQLYAEELSYDKQKQLNFVKLKESRRVNEVEVIGFVNAMVFTDGRNKTSVLKTEKDELGFSHTKLKITQNNISVFNKQIIAHCKEGKLVSLNGDLYDVKSPTNKFILTEKNALACALKKVNAKKYKWENKDEELQLGQTLNQLDFTYYPKGEKVIYEKNGKQVYAWRFDIYAEAPLYRANIFVDGASGKILGEQSLICNADVSATALTKYSSTQTLTCDQNGAIYRLREVQRGLGIETYNLNNTNVYAANDFTNATTSWTTVGFNQAATDAHWGAEKTYDFYFQKFNRNSIDNAGYKLLSYLHYNTNYNNAFWDGIRMTYGDGNGTGFTIFTALDVCGHEITHGLVSNSAGLNGGGTGEPDALNEAFADIFGTSIERFAKPATWNWKLGSDVTVNGNGFRNMQNPKLLNDPDTYLGQFWDPQGEPHNNAGPCIKWFYLLVAGGSGINDINSAYNVLGIGNTDAEKIAYRALTVYFTPSTGYLAARAGAIQAAKDLFGNCSNQVIQTTNAWYAVGVGPQYSPGVIGPNFSANITNICSMPANVSFNNTTANGVTYTWFFGDGTTSTSTNVIHTYTANGNYTVKLKAIGCLNNADSTTKNAYVIVNVPSSPIVSGAAACANSAFVLNANANATIKWYSSPISNTVLATGSSFSTPNLNTTTTYYVANTYSNSPAFGGRSTNTGGGFLNNASQWLEFDVLQNSKLNSVVIYAQTAGNRLIELRTAGNTVLNSTTANLNIGSNTVTLNYNLTVGVNYQLGLTNGSISNLYRSNSGNTYPYNVGGCVSITGSSAGTGFYYWFYNWQVTKDDCSSPRVPVTASVFPATPLTITTPATVVCMNDDGVPITASPNGGIFSGIGFNGTNFVPSTGVGTYTITYNYTDINGCTDSSSIEMLVQECTGLTSTTNSNHVSIYPNPTKSNIVIKNDLKNSILNAAIYDASGRLIFQKEIYFAEEEINLNNLSNGIYVLCLKSLDGSIFNTFKLVKQ